MNKFLTAVVAAAATLCASAEGYQVNTFSPKQEGMGHVGVAMELGAESTIFNPGALAFSTKTFEISGGISAISAKATATHQGTDYTTSNKVSTPFNVSTAFRIYDNLYAGVSLYTPYGSSINWGENWPGAVLNQSVDLKLFTVQPTISWRLLDNLSIGAGLMISWGSVDLNKGLVNPASMDKLLTLVNPSMTTGFGNVTPASVNLNGSSALAFGFNVGALYKINEKWNVGASFRSKMTMKVEKGAASVAYANDVARTLLSQTLDNLNYTNFSASMPAPYVLTFGTAYKPIEKLTLAFDAQLNGWGTYKQLDIEFDQLSAFDQHLKKDYHNSWTFHLGGQYAITKRFDVRAGLMVDLAPMDKELYNPETPGATKIEPSVGLSFRPIPQLSIDAAFMYVHGCKVNGATGEYEDFIGKNYPILGIPATGTFTADYKVHAVIPAIGISYAF